MMGLCALNQTDELREFDKKLVELQQKHLNKKNVLENDGKTYLKPDIKEEELGK